jgi:hypothetical protein
MDISDRLEIAAQEKEVCLRVLTGVGLGDCAVDGVEGAVAASFDGYTHGGWLLEEDEVNSRSR